MLLAKIMRVIKYTLLDGILVPFVSFRELKTCMDIVAWLSYIILVTLTTVGVLFGRVHWWIPVSSYFATWFFINLSLEIND